LLQYRLGGEALHLETEETAARAPSLPGRGRGASLTDASIVARSTFTSRSSNRYDENQTT
jgi:hypothetical protein